MFSKCCFGTPWHVIGLANFVESNGSFVSIYLHEGPCVAIGDFAASNRHAAALRGEGFTLTRCENLSRFPIAWWVALLWVGQNVAICIASKMLRALFHEEVVLVNLVKYLPHTSWHLKLVLETQCLLYILGAHAGRRASAKKRSPAGPAARALARASAKGVGFEQRNI